MEMTMKDSENGNGGFVGTTETVAAYEAAMKEFAMSSAEFLTHTALLTKARESYQRAMAVSSRLREALDSGDQTLRTLLAQVEQALAVQPGKDASDRNKSEALNVETIKASGEKANAART
jgi:exonuclease VII small subunit